MRSPEDRDELVPPAGMTRLHINTSDQSVRAIMALARHDNISFTEAHRRIIRYGELITMLTTATDLCGDDDRQCSISVPDGPDRVPLIRRRNPQWHWWKVRTPRFTVERLLFPDEEHTDEQLVVEQPLDPP